MYEYHIMQGQQSIFNAFFGGFAAYKVIPFQRAASGSYPLFRKTWMRYPIGLVAFAAGYYTANQIQTRAFPKMYFNYWKDGGQRIAPYLGGAELISQFRIFENNAAASADARSEIQDFVDTYTSGPLTKAEMLNRIRDGRPVDEQFASKFRIARKGKDRDDIFWAIGKIHGLENIALLDEDELKKAAGDPWTLQVLVNEANDRPKPLPPQNFDKLVEELH